ncbi:MAG: aminoacyl-histidine dipeptidase [Bacteroidales bacterium]|nr:aminoacyl-histidine dipeptidase [Bacteroidales bacterium]
MAKELKSLYPERLWHYFSEILTVPRPSKKEGKIIEYLLNFGNSLHLETLQDETGNILIRKPAMPGMEKLETVVLQSHIDMVCEKNAGTIHDFENDPIEAYIDGGWVKARGTTLGADDGIGIAAQLALLEAKDIPHGPVECLFTVDEETGLTGAFGLKPGWLKGTILLNLDSEDEGELFIGCAGGVDTVGEISYEPEKAPEGWEWLRISITGLTGGHSGDDIHKGRANAVKLLNRFLWNAYRKFNIRMGQMDAGNLRNAIAREGFALFCCAPGQSAKIEEYCQNFRKIYQNEYKTTEPDLKVELTKAQTGAGVWGIETQQKTLNALYACPHGVYAWSAGISGFVETSMNLASVKTNEHTIVITTSQRSSVESAKKDIRDMVASSLLLGDAAVKHSDGYPGWTPDPGSGIVRLTSRLYRNLFNKEPKVLAIHAGLECGLIGSVYPEMDMISFGPTIKGAHSPDERLEIETVAKFWDLLTDVLKNIPAVK